MKNKNSFFLLLLSSFLLLPACGKDDEIPQDYSYGFRCKVNGVEWTPYISSTAQWGIGNAVNFQYYDDVKFIGLFAKRDFGESSHTDQSMNFSAEPISIGENKIKDERNAFLDWNIPSPCGAFDIDSIKPNIINIKKIDRENRIISGTFQFSVFDPNCKESIDITDGEFEFGF